MFKIRQHFYGADGREVYSDTILTEARPKPSIVTGQTWKNKITNLKIIICDIEDIIKFYFVDIPGVECKCSSDDFYNQFEFEEQNDRV